MSARCCSVKSDVTISNDRVYKLYKLTLQCDYLVPVVFAMNKQSFISSNFSNGDPLHLVSHLTRPQCHPDPLYPLWLLGMVSLRGEMRHHFWGIYIANREVGVLERQRGCAWFLDDRRRVWVLFNLLLYGDFFIDVHSIRRPRRWLHCRMKASDQQQRYSKLR